MWNKYLLAFVKSLGVFMDLAYLALLQARGETRKYYAAVYYPSVRLVVMKEQSQETRC